MELKKRKEEQKQGELVLKMICMNKYLLGSNELVVGKLLRERREGRQFKSKVKETKKERDIWVFAWHGPLYSLKVYELPLNDVGGVGITVKGSGLFENILPLLPRFFFVSIGLLVVPLAQFQHPSILSIQLTMWPQGMMLINYKGVLLVRDDDLDGVWCKKVCE